MQVDVGAKAQRGQPEGERCCDICRTDGVTLHECRVLERYWYDICPGCARALQAVQIPSGSRQDRAFDEAKANLRAATLRAAERLLARRARQLTKGPTR
jgi:hypothetical protein